jgi:hypothetical protein
MTYRGARAQAAAPTRAAPGWRRRRRSGADPIWELLQQQREAMQALEGGPDQP